MDLICIGSSSSGLGSGKTDIIERISLFLTSSHMGIGEFLDMIQRYQWNDKMQDNGVSEWYYDIAGCTLRWQTLVELVGGGFAINGAYPV